MTNTITKTNTIKKHFQRAIQETCDLWDIWSEWWGHMTWPTQTRWTKTKTKTMTKTNTFREHLQRATLETCDHWDIWSGWWEHMTWPIKRRWQRQRQRQGQWQIQIHLENTFKERPYRLMTFETFYQSDKVTWPDQQKDNYSDNDKDKYKYLDHDRDRHGVWTSVEFITFQTVENLNSGESSLWLDN